MKNRIRLLKYQLVYLLFNPKYIKLIILLIFLTIGIIEHNIILYLIIAILGILLISLIMKKYGTILLGIHTKTKLKITMRGICPKKLKKYRNEEINSMFLKDFKNLLSRNKINKDIIINTHGLYAQGVLKLLYTEFSPKEKPVKLKSAAQNKMCYCNGIIVNIKEVTKHHNIMASMKISLIGKQKIIDDFFKKEYTYYEIKIPKELFN
ncbi:MAG: hypothetical protein Q4D26_11515 [Clostridia bacterium]|nr:hypothetical protein [Clostridia bacterium]